MARILTIGISGIAFSSTLGHHQATILNDLFLLNPKLKGLTTFETFNWTPTSNNPNVAHCGYSDEDGLDNPELVVMHENDRPTVFNMAFYLHTLKLPVLYVDFESPPDIGYNVLHHKTLGWPTKYTTAWVSTDEDKDRINTPFTHLQFAARPRKNPKR